MIQKIDLGGTIRACTPEQTIARLQPQLARFGITRVADVTGLDTIGIPVVMCIRPNAKTLAVSQGKGSTVALATASAVMESIELHHAENPPTPTTSSVAELTALGHSFLHPQDLGVTAYVGNWTPDTDLDWLEGRDLRSGDTTLVPYATVSLDLTKRVRNPGLVPRNSNGLASGNNLEEAVLHGLCEVVERDAEWRFQQLSRDGQRARLIDHSTIDSPNVRRLLDRYHAAEVLLAVWDVTSSVGLPCYRATLIDKEGWRGLSRFYGAGCHLSKEVAISRALTEAAQCRLTYISGSRDDLLPSYYELKRHDRDNAPAIEFRRGTHSYAETVSPRLGDGFDRDCEVVLAQLSKDGFPRAVAVDLSRTDTDGVAVAKVIVPGMKRAH